jgi:uncharacterized membrane protein
MIKKHFSFEETVRFGWAKTVQHAWFLFLTFIITEIILNAVKFTPFLNVVVALFVGLSLASISLVISRDQHFTFADLYNPLLSPLRVIKFIALTAIYSIPGFLLLMSYIVREFGAPYNYNSPSFFVAGTIFCFVFAVPVVYFSVRLKFFPYVLLDNEHASIKEILTKTYRLTTGHFWPVLAFLLALAAINTLGFLFFVIGLLVTVPVSLFATAHVYNKLKEHSF